MEKYTVKKWEDLSFDEKEEISKLFTNWLGEYTDKVVLKVMRKKEEILNNSTVIVMLKELYKLEKSDMESIEFNIYKMLNGGEKDFEHAKAYGIRPIHSSSRSYRDVLYDLYIK